MTGPTPNPPPFSPGLGTGHGGVVLSLWRRHNFTADFRLATYGGECGAPQFFWRIFGGLKFGGESGARRRLRGLEGASFQLYINDENTRSS